MGIRVAAAVVLPLFPFVLGFNLTPTSPLNGTIVPSPAVIVSLCICGVFIRYLDFARD